MHRIPRYYRDLLERVGWTAAQAGLGLVTVDALHIPVAYAAVVATLLAVAKGFVARHVGNGDSASTAKGV